MTLANQDTHQPTIQLDHPPNTSQIKRRSTETKQTVQILQNWYNDKYRSIYPYPIPFFEQHLFRVTMSFRPELVTLYEPTWMSPAAMMKPMEAYGKLNHLVMRRLVGGHYHRKKWQQPLTLAWVDFEGSRHLPIIHLESARKPHIHAVVLVHPCQRLKFQLFISDPFMRRQMPAIHSVKIEQFNSSLDSLHEFISYCNKGYDKLAVDDQKKLDMRLSGTFP